MKILCLHGYAESNEILARKCTQLTQVLDKFGIEPIFANGPMPVLKFGEEWETATRRDLRAWWTIGEYDGQFIMKTAIESLASVIEAHGPFSGVMGFSQGSALAGVLAGNMGELFPNHPPLLFGLFFSGFTVADPGCQHFYDHTIPIPTCHVIGEYDTIIEPESSMRFYDLCEKSNRVLVTHPGGHFVPSSPQALRQIQAFFEGIFGAPESERRDKL